MPANLTPEYYETEREYRQAKTHEEKLGLLKKMLAVMPKHKGTEKIQADLRSKISKLNKIMQKKPLKKERDPFSHIDKEGAGQIMLIGKPNTGKSQIISALTNANSPATIYPFSTRKPVIGMMDFEDIKIQLVDTPSITKNFMENWLPQLIRETDIVAMVVDLSQEDILEQVEEIKETLASERISLGQKEEGHIAKKPILICNKSDSPEAETKFKMLNELYKGKFTAILSVSALKEEWGNLKRTMFDCLNVIRIYTKPPGKPFKKGEPFIVEEGTKVSEAAVAVHKDFANLKFARLWDGQNYSGQRVDRAHILKDKDILELHM
jgi:ribosome-interacting GTPase 1